MYFNKGWERLFSLFLVGVLYIVYVLMKMNRFYMKKNLLVFRINVVMFILIWLIGGLKKKKEDTFG